MLRSSLFLSLFLILGLSLNAQRAQRGGSSSDIDRKFEIKANPIGLLFGNPSLSFEYILSENFGLEASPTLFSRNRDIFGEDASFSGAGLGIFAKYYFSPDKPASKFYVAPYIRFFRSSTTLTNSDELVNTRLAAGFMPGFKWVSDSNVSFEIAFGLGRAFINELEGTTADFGLNLDAVGRFAVGYRF